MADPIDDPPPPDPDSPELPDAPLYVPELDADEARNLDHESALIVNRRVRVMHLYRKRRTMPAIAQEVGCSVGTVHRDIHIVLDGYRRQLALDSKLHVAHELQRLAHREAEIELDLERSRGDLVEKSRTGKRDSDGDGTVGGSVKKRQRYGDPRLHALLVQCWRARCVLLGLLDKAETGADKLPAVKVVAGLNPLEVV